MSNDPKTRQIARDTKSVKRDPKTGKKDTKSLPLANRGRKRRVGLPRFLSPEILVLLATLILVALLFPYSSAVQTFDVPKEGEVAKETIIAPFTFDILKSPEELEREKKRVRERVLLVTDFDAGVREDVLEEFNDLRSNLRLVLSSSASESTRAKARDRISKELSDNTVNTLLDRPYLLDDALVQAQSILSEGVLSVLLVGSKQELNEARAEYNTSFDRHLFYNKSYVSLRRDTTEKTVPISEVPVKEIALENAIQELKRGERRFDSRALNCVYELLFAYVRPNIQINGKETARRKQMAAEDVLPIKGKVIKDTEIVRKHQEVTGEVVEKLRSLRTAVASLDSAGEKRRIMAANISKALLALIPLIFLAIYVRNYHPRVMRDTRHMIALATIIVLQVAIIRVGLLIVPRLFEGSSELTQVLPEYLIPVSVASMLVTILFSLELSFVVTFYIAILFGIVLGFNHAMFLFALLGGLVAGSATRSIRYRWDFFKAIPPVFAIYAVVIILWHIAGFKISPLSMIQNVSLGVINAIAATFLAMMGTAIFENLFDITTDLTLVELSDMNHPVLKRLSIEAAGTYNHSVLVANLAESAAVRVGANPLLVRVASYYHDIGKLEKSDYFVENVVNKERSKHHKLSPSMSALIISSHVKEGVELARRHKLPKVIQDAILEHHGMSTVSFFYEKALEQDPHKQVQEKDFRYPGPRPQTRETAIIMLADSVEAASRSLATSSPKLLRELVKKIIRDKFTSSQLDQCELTLRDLDEIVEGFMPVLQGIFHTRIEYPNK